MNAALTLRGFAVRLTVTLAIAGLTAAKAVPMLRISDGITTITVTDGGIGDSNPAPGVVSWSGSIGVWTTNILDGITKPVLGVEDHPMLDLSFTNISSGAGTLTLMFTETGFSTRALSRVRMDIAGSTAGSVIYSTYSGFGGANQNTPFDMTRFYGSTGPFTGVFADKHATGILVPTSGAFSLTQVLTITHAGAGLTSGNALLEVPEFGATLPLFALGLCGIFYFRRKM